MKTSDELKQDLYRLEDAAKAYLKAHYKQRDALLDEIKKARAKEIEQQYGLRIGMYLTVNDELIESSRYRLSVTAGDADLPRAIVNGKVSHVKITAFDSYLDKATVLAEGYGWFDWSFDILVTML